MPRVIQVLCFMLLSALLFATPVMANELVTRRVIVGTDVVDVRIPYGFELEVLTTELDRPRIIHNHNGTLLIGSKSGSVYQLDKPYTEPFEVASLRDYPHSVVVHENYLYVAHTSGVIRTSWPLSDRANEFPLSNKHFEKVVSVPGGGGHNSRTLKLGPDSKLYMSLGLTGNCSNEYLDESYPWNDQRGGMFVLEPIDENQRSVEATHQLVPYASGLRNPVGFDWHPSTGVMYASNNGPDHLGYEIPRESFAKITANSFHGMPWFQRDGDKLLRDPCIQSEPPRPSSDVAEPVATFPARIAPMDVGFAREGLEGWSSFQGDAIVALHGSWATSDGGGRGDPSTRREPMIVRVEFNDEGVSTGDVHSLIEGFQLENGHRWARPMGIAFGNDGSLFFTSDGGTEGLYRLRPLSQSQ